jgi:hypothetical protein
VLADTGDGLARCCGKLKRLLSQLPGKFCPPESIDPSGSIFPGHPMPIKGASFRLARLARLIRRFSIRANPSTASSRLSFTSSGSLRMIDISVLIFSALRMIEARPIASSPTRLPLKPPPTTIRSASFQCLSFRNRAMTPANSWAKDSIAPWMTPALSSSPLARMASSFFLASLPDEISPKGSSPISRRGLRQFQ